MPLDSGDTTMIHEVMVKATKEAWRMWIVAMDDASEEHGEELAMPDHQNTLII